MHQGLPLCRAQPSSGCGCASPLRSSRLPGLLPPQGVENVYTQHTPALVGLLERLARSKLPEMDYPRVDRNSSPQAPRVGAVLSSACALQIRLPACTTWACSCGLHQHSACSSLDFCDSPGLAVCRHAGAPAGGGVCGRGHDV